MKKIKIKCKCKEKEVDFKKMLVPFLSDKELKANKDAMIKGNFPATMTIILHNQKIISDRLNTLLKRK